MDTETGLLWGLEEGPRKDAKFREMVLGVKARSLVGLEQFSLPIILLSIPCALWTNSFSRVFVDFAVPSAVATGGLPEACSTWNRQETPPPLFPFESLL